MKHLTTVLVLAFLLTLAPGPAAHAGLDARAASKADTKESRDLKRLTCRKIPKCDKDASYWEGDDKGRIRGDDGAGVYVFIQYRKCGQGKWANLTRETTTATGAWDFYYTYKASEKKKYQVKEYKADFPDSVQFSFFIPASDAYKPYRSVSPFCYG